MDRRNWLKISALAIPSLALPKTIIGNWLNKSFNFIKAKDFGSDFLWGAACASYQVEGAWNTDGKGPSIWDTFTHKKGKIHNNENADVATDFYHRYKEDIATAKALKMQVFRFSISWTRILPDGIGKLNEKGLQFYHKVIDECIEQGIEPWVTLYHWDLPQKLQDKGDKLKVTR